MKKLHNAYQDFKEVKFPNSSSNPLLSDIFTDLVQYDSYIAGLVDKILKNKPFKRSELYFDINLEQRIHEFISESKAKDDIECAKSYLQYLDKIRDLINATASIMR